MQTQARELLAKIWNDNKGKETFKVTSDNLLTVRTVTICALAICEGLGDIAEAIRSREEKQ